MSNYKNKYIYWKTKYLNLKTQTESHKYKHEQIAGWSSWFNFSDTSNNIETNSELENLNFEQKTEPGRGILGDALYYFVANTGIDGKLPDPAKSWTYKEPQIESINPDIVPYTDINQALVEKLYNHSRSEYEEGFDIGYIVGYECGCNQNTTPDKQIPPGNINNPDFVKGFIEGFGLGFQKGTKYYYTTWIQINNNNIMFKKKLIDHVANSLPQQPDSNYDPIEEKSYDDYYVYLQKKIIGKKHYI